MDGSQDTYGDYLIDVSSIPLSRLDSISSSLGVALRRALDDDQTGLVAGFQSNI